MLLPDGSLKSLRKTRQCFVRNNIIKKKLNKSRLFSTVLLQYNVIVYKLQYGNVFTHYVFIMHENPVSAK